MSAEGQMQVWWHRQDGKRDRAEATVVSSVMGARAIYRACEREGYHAIRVMQKKRGRWVELSLMKLGIGTSAQQGEPQG